MPCRYERSLKGAGEAYLDGVSLRRLRLCFHLSEGELRDLAPEEFTESLQTDGDAGGY